MIRHRLLDLKPTELLIVMEKGGTAEIIDFLSSCFCPFVVLAGVQLLASLRAACQAYVFVRP